MPGTSMPVEATPPANAVLQVPLAGTEGYWNLKKKHARIIHPNQEVCPDFMATEIMDSWTRGFCRDLSSPIYLHARTNRHTVQSQCSMWDIVPRPCSRCHENVR